MTQVDLLAAAEQRTPRPPRGPLGPLLVGALSLALVAVVLYALADRGVGDREQQLTDLTAQTQASVAEVERLAPFVATQTEARTRAEQVAELARTRFPWERALDDLTRVLPAEAALSSAIAALPQPADGATADAAAATLTLKGCLPSQAAVPGLLSRLETIRGVASVDLNTSDGDADAAAACSGDAPSFDVVVSFAPRSGDATPAATPAPAADAAATPAGEGA